MMPYIVKSDFLSHSDPEQDFEVVIDDDGCCYHTCFRKGKIVDFDLTSYLSEIFFFPSLKFLKVSDHIRNPNTYRYLFVISEEKKNIESFEKKNVFQNRIINNIFDVLLS